MAVKRAKPSPCSPVVTTPIVFYLLRLIDVSGTSGVGIVADGAWFPNGKVVVAWRGTMPTVNVYDSLAHVEAIHGHEGATVVLPCDTYASAGST